MKNTGQSRAQSLPLICLILLMAASLTICRADPQAAENLPVLHETQRATAIYATDWRKALHTEFKYTPAAPSNVAVQPEAVLKATASPDVVVLPKYVVRGAAPDHRDLEKGMRPPSKGADKVAKKLGIGRREVKFRHFSIGCDTIFFIPVSGGISW